MASIFNALHIGYSGLNVSQVGINTTGHNIANAETEGYSRQRVFSTTALPVNISPGHRGNGADVAEIVRVFDNFVFGRYTDASEKKEYSDEMRKVLEELSSYFPDIDGVGIKADMYEYFNLWQSLADNPDNNAIKVALAQQTQTMTQHIQQTRDMMTKLRSNLDDQIEVAVNEVNRIAADIAELNKAIAIAESDGVDNANDLRDKRNVLERSLAKLIGSDLLEGQIESNMPIDSNIAVPHGSYSLHVSGFNLIDGGSHHPITLESSQNPFGLNDLYYERQDGLKFEIAERIRGGKIGALLDLRGHTIDSVTGEPNDGQLQSAINNLDALAQQIIEVTNNIYARTPQVSMNSNVLDLNGSTPLVNSDLNLQQGSFNIAVYDAAGNEVATRNIVINSTTTMETALALNVLPDGTPNSIREQILALKDDNVDNNLINDIDDFIYFSYADDQLTLGVQNRYASQGYMFKVTDSDSEPTNFAGSIGLNRFFDGENSRNIELASALKKDPSSINASDANVAGNASVAHAMVQLQFDKVSFTTSHGLSIEDSFYGFYDAMVSDIGTKTNLAIARNDALTAQYNAIELEYQSISKVSIDEEMTNLIKYQTSYGAAAKVITTIDQMMDTLLGLKR